MDSVEEGFGEQEHVRLLQGAKSNMSERFVQSHPACYFIGAPKPCEVIGGPENQKPVSVVEKAAKAVHAAKFAFGILLIYAKLVDKDQWKPKSQKTFDVLPEDKYDDEATRARKYAPTALLYDCGLTSYVNNPG